MPEGSPSFSVPVFCFYDGCGGRRWRLWEKGGSEGGRGKRRRMERSGTFFAHKAEAKSVGVMIPTPTPPALTATGKGKGVLSICCGDVYHVFYVIYIYIYIYVSIHVHIHIHTHIYIYIYR
jgi:hypothetical protein